MRDEIVHNLESAAWRCKVTRRTVVAWIEQGLRAMPIVGTTTKYRPRDYVILDKHLIEFIESRARIASPIPALPYQKPTPRPAVGSPRPINSGSLMKPCPV